MPTELFPSKATYPNNIVIPPVALRHPAYYNESVQLLINKLRQLQYGLTPALRNTEFLYNKLVTAC